MIRLGAPVVQTSARAPPSLQSSPPARIIVVTPATVIVAEQVRAERVAEEVEALAPGVPNRGLGLVEGEPEPGHHLPRPRQSLSGVAAAEDDMVGLRGPHSVCLLDTPVTSAFTFC